MPIGPKVNLGIPNKRGQLINFNAEFVDKTPIEYILTVPAVWSDKSKSDTLKCAVDAGFCSAGEVSLITEPEAAAVYTFTTVSALLANLYGTI